jgi:hypothetical protein
MTAAKSNPTTAQLRRVYQFFFLRYHLMQVLSFTYALSYFVIAFILFFVREDWSIITGILLLFLGGLLLALNFKFWLYISNAELTRVKADRADFPEIHDFIKTTSAELGVSLPSKVYFSGDSRIHTTYSFRINSWFFGARPTLILGAPALAFLDEKELKCLLTKELYKLKSPYKGSFAALQKMTLLLNRVVWDNKGFQELYVPFSQDFPWIEKISFGQTWIFRSTAGWMQKEQDRFRKSVLSVLHELEYESDQFAAHKFSESTLSEAIIRQEVASTGENLAHHYMDHYMRFGMAPDNKIAWEFTCANQYFTLKNAKFERDRLCADQQFYNTFLAPDLILFPNDFYAPIAALRLEKLNFTSYQEGNTHRPARDLIPSITAIEKKITKLFLLQIGFAGSYKAIGAETVVEKMQKEFLWAPFPTFYNHCFDDVNPSLIDPTQSEMKTLNYAEVQALFLEGLPAKMEELKKLRFSESTLTPFRDYKEQAIDFFYKGTMHRAIQGSALNAFIKSISQSIDALEKAIQADFDTVYFSAFQGATESQREELLRSYKAYQDGIEEHAQQQNLCAEIRDRLNTIQVGVFNFNEHHQKLKMNELLEVQPRFQELVKQLAEEAAELQELDPADAKKLEQYVKENWIYTGLYKSGIQPLPLVIRALELTPNLSTKRFHRLKNKFLMQQWGALSGETSHLNQ